MKAAVMTAFREPLEIQSLPDPAPGPDDAVVGVEACGICRSDWHLWQQDWTWVGVNVELPRVPGHEFGGVVAEAGANVKRFKPGDRVTVPFHLGCGDCVYCWTGRSNLCLAFGVIGVHHNGGYGNLARIPNADSTLVRLPDEVDALSAAALGCRFMTAYHGLVDQAAIAPGEWVAIFGMGGVGLSAVQIGSALGARVVAVSRSAGKLEKATQEGAVATVHAGENAVQEILDITGGGADVSVDAFGAAEPTVHGIASLAKGGRHVQLGMTGANEKGVIPVPMDLVVFKEARILGSFGCPTTSYRGLLSLVSAGKLNPERLAEEAVPVTEVNRVLNEMTDFKTRGFSLITKWD